MPSFLLFFIQYTSFVVKYPKFPSRSPWVRSSVFLHKIKLGS